MKWEVRWVDAGWGVRRGNEWWHDTFSTHAEAVIWAERYAVCDMIFDGYLARVGELKRWLNAGYQ